MSLRCPNVRRITATTAASANVARRPFPCLFPRRWRRRRLSSTARRRSNSFRARSSPTGTSSSRTWVKRDGKVYKVLDREINEKVALKLIKREISADRQTIERFQNEIKITRRITHKNVCRMYHLGRENDTYYITMEFIRGENLKKIIRMTKELSLEATLNITRQICDGLVEAHRLGIVHRDLKPQNIMIDEEGDVRIMDFGIASSIETKERPSRDDDRNARIHEPGADRRRRG